MVRAFVLLLSLGCMPLLLAGILRAQEKSKTPSVVRARRPQVVRFAKKAVKRLVSFTLAIYFIPWVLAGYVACGSVQIGRASCRERV